ncbi:MAG: hypothetical protein RMJ38_00985 [candidate division WOR-3 bacterium]|nr:hypothetical protein [candidate division WOR-3 bacterium]MDW8150004.1 hypothetical protein [candidate division WOR-3 bacterium]
MNDEKEKRVKDIVNSLGLYISKETGILKGDYSNKEIGILGSYQTDILDTAKRYKEEKISRNEAKEEIHASTVKAIIAPIVEVGYNVLAVGISKLLSRPVPLLAPVVNTTLMVLRKPIVETITNIVTGVVQKVKNFLLKLFS